MAFRSYPTEYGVIHHSTVCKDDWGNLRTHPANPKVRLQGPALRSFRAAEDRVGAIAVTGTLRTCEYQAALYAEDPQRFASPNSTLHTQGLAVDISMAMGSLKRRRVKRALLARGWRQSRPDDEPHHFSYYLKA